jgi:hypothetical protein
MVSFRPFLDAKEVQRIFSAMETLDDADGALLRGSDIDRMGDSIYAGLSRRLARTHADG